MLSCSLMVIFYDFQAYLENVRNEKVFCFSKVFYQFLFNVFLKFYKM